MRKNAPSTLYTCEYLRVEIIFNVRFFFSFVVVAGLLSLSPASFEFHFWTKWRKQEKKIMHTEKLFFPRLAPTPSASLVAESEIWCTGAAEAKASRKSISKEEKNAESVFAWSTKGKRYRLREPRSLGGWWKQRTHSRVMLLCSQPKKSKN